MRSQPTQPAAANNAVPSSTEDFYHLVSAGASPDSIAWPCLLQPLSSTNNGSGMEMRKSKTAFSERIEGPLWSTRQRFPFSSTHHSTTEEQADTSSQSQVPESRVPSLPRKSFVDSSSDSSARDLRFKQSANETVNRTNHQRGCSVKQPGKKHPGKRTPTQKAGQE
jgi:hypothetical protein